MMRFNMTLAPWASVLVMVMMSQTSAFVSVGKNVRISPPPQTVLSLMPLDVAGIVEANNAYYEQLSTQSFANQLHAQSYHQPKSVMMDGIRGYVADTATDPSSSSSTTLMLSLKDRPPPPTPEEIAAKQRNFNFWFWGGGFVAPFLATFYYFGFKFWEK